MRFPLMPNCLELYTLRLDVFLVLLCTYNVGRTLKIVNAKSIPTMGLQHQIESEVEKLGKSVSLFQRYLTMKIFIFSLEELYTYVHLFLFLIEKHFGEVKW